MKVWQLSQQPVKRTDIAEKPGQEASVHAGLQIVLCAPCVMLPPSLQMLPEQDCYGSCCRDCDDDAQVQLKPVEALPQLLLDLCNGQQTPSGHQTCRWGHKWMKGSCGLGAFRGLCPGSQDSIPEMRCLQVSHSPWTRPAEVMEPAAL